MAQNKASLWGTVVGFVPPPIIPHIPQTCPEPPSRHRAQGGALASLRAHFPVCSGILSLCYTPTSTNSTCLLLGGISRSTHLPMAFHISDVHLFCSNQYNQTQTTYTNT